MRWWWWWRWWYLTLGECSVAASQASKEAWDVVSYPHRCASYRWTPSRALMTCYVYNLQPLHLGRSASFSLPIPAYIMSSYSSSIYMKGAGLDIFPQLWYRGRTCHIVTRLHCIPAPALWVITPVSFLPRGGRVRFMLGLSLLHHAHNYHVLCESRWCDILCVSRVCDHAHMWIRRYHRTPSCPTYLDLMVINYR